MENTSLSNQQLGEVQERQAKALKNIQDLQNLEKQLFTGLETSAASASPDLKQQEQTINRINELSNMRINLYKNLQSMYTVLQSNVADTRSDLVDQTAVVGIVEKELNNAKKNIGSIKDARNNKLRMVEINTYFGKRYQAHSYLMRLIVILCIPLIILAVLTRKGFIPSNIGTGLTVVVIVIGIILIARKLIDMYMRSNMNYDEYNWDFDPNASQPTVIEYDMNELGNIRGDLQADMDLSCVGQECCSTGTVWDDKNKRCTKGFINGQLTKGAFDKGTKADSGLTSAIKGAGSDISGKASGVLQHLESFATF